MTPYGIDISKLNDDQSQGFTCVGCNRGDVGLEPIPIETPQSVCLFICSKCKAQKTTRVMQESETP
jgi:hypothetical protein